MRPQHRGVNIASFCLAPNLLLVASHYSNITKLTHRKTESQRSDFFPHLIQLKNNLAMLSRSRFIHSYSPASSFLLSSTRQRSFASVINISHRAGAGAGGATIASSVASFPSSLSSSSAILRRFSTAVSSSSSAAFDCFSSPSVAVPMHFSPRRTITQRADVRNIAVIAHVDHGKSTLVDSLLKFSGTMKNAKNRVMDSNDQEKERGITILAKNTAVLLDDGKRRINIVDTPGHLDFSGEVERTLQTVEGFLLLVDAAEGVKPGTRYVLRKALALNLKPIVIVNKIDKDASRIEKVCEEVENLFLDTAVNDDQLEINFLYGSGRDGYMNKEPKVGGNMDPLFDLIFSSVPPPMQPKDDCGLQMLVSQVDEDPKTNEKILTGHVFRGSIKKDQIVSVLLGNNNNDDKNKSSGNAAAATAAAPEAKSGAMANGGTGGKALVREIALYCGVEHIKVNEASFGDTCVIRVQEPRDTPNSIPLVIGSSVCAETDPQPWPYRAPDEPTFSLVVSEMRANWKEKELKDTTKTLWREVKARLRRESMVNTALRLSEVTKKDGSSADPDMTIGSVPSLMMSGRGPLHLGVIVEAMRREGYEFELRAPRVVTRMIDGEVHEPYEKVSLDFKEALSAEVIGLLVQRQAEMGDLKNVGQGRVGIEAVLPVRLMMNLPLEFNRLTGGDGILNHSSEGFRKQVIAPEERPTGSLIANDAGEVTQYSLNNVGKHGKIFVEAGEYVYVGQIVGENLGARHQDVPVNVTKRNEQLGGMRANAADAEKHRKKTVRSEPMRLEECMGWLHESEMIAVTPQSVRMRKPGFAGKTINRLKDKGRSDKM